MCFCRFIVDDFQDPKYAFEPSKLHVFLSHEYFFQEFAFDSCSKGCSFSEKTLQYSQKNTCNCAL